MRTRRGTATFLTIAFLGALAALNFQPAVAKEVPPVNSMTDNESVDVVIDWDKYLLANMLQYVNVDTQVNIYEPNMIPSDKSKIHVGLNKAVTAEEINALLSLPGEHSLEYFSLAEIKANAPLLKAKGIEVIDYDLEPGTNHSPAGDLADPLASIKAASQAAHANGLSFRCSPAKALTTEYGSAFAPYCDEYNIQAQSLQGNPAAYQSYVSQTVSKLRNANPDIQITTQLSTQREAASGMTLLETMKLDFTLIAEKVDGVTLWFANNEDSFTVVESFVKWFNTESRT